VLDSLRNTIEEIYNHFSASKEVPSSGFIQISKIALICAILYFHPFKQQNSPTCQWHRRANGGIDVDSSVMYLGFVAGTLGRNRMVANGDWIKMLNYGADGDVIGSNTHHGQVQNWDKTVTTIPTYALISESFKKLAWHGGIRWLAYQTRR
jgi:miniconductance mechanosensitive channel